MNCLIFLFLVSQVVSDMKSMEHSVYMSRKSRSNSAPTHSGYMYSKFNEQPRVVSTYGFSEDSGPPNFKYGAASTEFFEPAYFNYVDTNVNRPYKRIIEVTEPTVTKYNIDAAIANAEAKYNSKYIPSKIKSGVMYERLKSVMHYHPPDNTLEPPVGYDMYDYHLDDDDVRTSSRGLYDNWPYFYHSPYEYEHSKIDSEIEKAKDKRYATDSMSIIPVHEKVDDIPDTFNQNFIQPYHVPTTNNPIHGNAPFFSYVLNDYYNKNKEEDLLTFKGMNEWGKEFDYQPKLYVTDAYTKKKRQDLDSILKNIPTTPSSQNGNYLPYNNIDNNVSNYEGSSTKKGYEKKNEYDKSKKRLDLKENSKSSYENNGNMYKSFKDLIESLANKFGGEDHKKDSKYVFKTNQDKGEKKKGFKRVYHKDEYQEDNEFYDNNNNSVKAEESGHSKGHFGGSETLARSQAAVALGDEGKAFNHAGNNKHDVNSHNHIGHDYTKGTENQLNKYRHVAEEAARNNNADYTEQGLIRL